MNRFTTFAVGFLAASATALTALPVLAQDAAPATPAPEAQAAPDGQPPVLRRGGDRGGERDGARGGDRGGERRGGPGHRGGPMKAEFLAAFDANGDGVVTQAELTQGIEAMKVQYDANGDGSLSLEEFSGLYAELTRPMTVRAFQRVDRDGDGQISAEEQAAAIAAFASRLPVEAPAN